MRLSKRLPSEYDLITLGGKMKNRHRPKLAGMVISIMLLVVPIAFGSDQEESLLPSHPLAAARTFEAKQCILCHHIDFRREGYGPDLGRISLGGNMYDIVGRMWNSAPDMVSKMEEINTEFPVLTPGELADLLGYLGVYQNYVVHYGRQADVDNGRDLFQEKNCPSCHTFDSDANTAGPSLKRFRGSGSPLSVLRAMWLHSYYMRKAGQRMGIEWPSFKGGEINDLLAFIVSGDQSENASPRYLKPGSPQVGRRLYESYECDNCHSIKGSGATEAPDLGNMLGETSVDIYVVLEMLWNHSPTMWETWKKKGQRVPVITTDDLADIVAYLFFVSFDRSTGSIDEGRQLFESKSCANCHEPQMSFTNKTDLLARIWNHVPQMLEQTRQDGIEWPIFSDGEISSLMEYMSSVKED